MPHILRLCRWLLPALALCLSGCLEYEDHLTLAPDGSGTWSYRVVLGPQLAAIMQSEDGSGQLQIAGDSTMAEGEFREEVDEIPGAKVTQFESRKEGDKLIVDAAIEFTDLAPVVDGDVGRTMGWGFRREGEQLVVTAMTTLADFDNSPTIQIGGKDGDFNMMKSMFAGARIKKTLTLPYAIVDGNADSTKDKTATWEMAITPELEEDEFTRMKSFTPSVRCEIAEFAPELPMLPPARKKREEKSASPAAGAEEAPREIIDAKGLDFEPVSLRIVRTRHFQRGILIGNPESYIRFEMSWPKNLQPSAFSSLVATEVFDDTDRELTSAPSFHADSARQLVYVQNKARTAEFDLFFEAPSSKAEKVSIAGSMLLHVPVDLTTAQLPLPNAGAPIEPPGFADFSLIMERVEGSFFSLKSERDLSHLVRVQLERDGELIDPIGIQGSSWDGGSHLQCHFAGDVAGTTLVLTRAGAIQKQRANFQFKKVKLP